MKEQTLNFFGSDSGFGEKNNSAYFEDENELFLIDCGFTVFSEIKNKFDFKKYDKVNIIITHLHNDHAGSLSQVIMYLWFVYNIKTNVISKCENISQYLEITGTPIEAYQIFSNLDNLEFIKTEHVPHLDSYGFKLNLKNKAIMYTGDTNTLEPFLNHLTGINELYVDVSKNGGVHLKYEDAKDNFVKLEESGVRVFLMHIDDKEYFNNMCKNLLVKII